MPANLPQAPGNVLQVQISPPAADAHAEQHAEQATQIGQWRPTAPTICIAHLHISRTYGTHTIWVPTGPTGKQPCEAAAWIQGVTIFRTTVGNKEPDGFYDRSKNAAETGYPMTRTMLLWQQNSVHLALTCSVSNSGDTATNKNFLRPTVLNELLRNTAFKVNPTLIHSDEKPLINAATFYTLQLLSVEMHDNTTMAQGLCDGGSLGTTLLHNFYNEQTPKLILFEVEPSKDNHVLQKKGTSPKVLLFRTWTLTPWKLPFKAERIIVKHDLAKGGYVECKKNNGPGAKRLYDQELDGTCCQASPPHPRALLYEIPGGTMCIVHISLAAWFLMNYGSDAFGQKKTPIALMCFSSLFAEKLEMLESWTASACCGNFDFWETCRGGRRWQAFTQAKKPLYHAVLDFASALLASAGTGETMSSRAIAAASAAHTLRHSHVGEAADWDGASAALRSLVTAMRQCERSGIFVTSAIVTGTRPQEGRPGTSDVQFVVPKDFHRSSIM